MFLLDGPLYPYQPPNLVVFSTSDWLSDRRRIYPFFRNCKAHRSIIYGHKRKKPANPFILLASTILMPNMCESRQEHQNQRAAGGDGDGRMHSRFVEYSLLSRSFLTFPSSFFYLHTQCLPPCPRPRHLPHLTSHSLLLRLCC